LRQMSSHCKADRGKIGKLNLISTKNRKWYWISSMQFGQTSLGGFKVNRVPRKRRIASS